MASGWVPANGDQVRVRSARDGVVMRSEQTILSTWIWVQHDNGDISYYALCELTPVVAGPDPEQGASDE